MHCHYKISVHSVFSVVHNLIQTSAFYYYVAWME